jgi:dolichol kinase
MYVDKVGDRRMRYFNRKIIHILAGGIVAFLVPFLFSSPLIPFIMGIGLAILILIPYLTGNILYWFQVPENKYDVHFCIMWGIMFLLSWYIWNDLIHGVVIVSFIAIGDAVTGLTRNIIIGERTKHWYGNIAMLIVSLPIAIYYLGTNGIVPAIVASLIEKIEYKWIDDNILIPLSAFLILIILI